MAYTFDDDDDDDV